MQVIGRQREKLILHQLLNSKRAEFIAVYGRRRVGKTFLIQQVLSPKTVYMECTGIKDGKINDQLKNFIASFEKTFYPGLSLKIPKSWREAFELLTLEYEKIPRSKKIVLFLDELPWLAAPKSELLQNLDYFWNTQWNKFSNFKLVVCGSAASWMLSHLINAKGGLHNRITKSILLEPFTLDEVKQYFVKNKLKFNDKQILDIYMVMGGIPYYLSQIQKSKSVAQNIDDICFKPDGLLYSEFPRLFASLFDSNDLYLQIVREIADYRYGISLTELVNRTGKKIGGRFNERLAELEAAGFIQRFLPYGKKKRDNYYKIVDEYTLFYLHWIEKISQTKALPKSSAYWAKISSSSKWQSWAGYAFEAVCYKHIDRIINSLGLNGVNCLIGSWKYIPIKGSKEQGTQIDLLIDRDDDAISVCEIKYSANPFVIDKQYAKNLISKLEIFQNSSKTPKQLFLVLISAMGVKKNNWSSELIDAVVELKDLF